MDNDGDLDVITNEFHDGPMVLTSNLSEKKNVKRLMVQLVGKGQGASNRDGLGAVVTVQVDGKKYTKVNDGVSGYLSHSLIPLYFGLGDANSVDLVTVKWPSGKLQEIREVDMNVSLKIVEAE